MFARVTCPEFGSATWDRSPVACPPATSGCFSGFFFISFLFGFFRILYVSFTAGTFPSRRVKNPRTDGFDKWLLTFTYILRFKTRPSLKNASPMCFAGSRRIDCLVNSPHFYRYQIIEPVTELFEKMLLCAHFVNMQRL